MSLQKSSGIVYWNTEQTAEAATRGARDLQAKIPMRRRSFLQCKWIPNADGYSMLVICWFNFWNATAGGSTWILPCFDQVIECTGPSAGSTFRRKILMLSLVSVESDKTEPLPVRYKVTNSDTIQQACFLLQRKKHILKRR